MSWLHTHRYWLGRRTTQLGILVLFWLGAHTGFDVLTGNLSSSRILGVVPMSDPYAVLQILSTGQSLAGTVLLGALVTTLFYFAVGGRSFCGWVCPVDLLSDTSAWLRRRFRIRGQFRVHKSTRFWIMALAFPVSAAAGVAAFEWTSPIGILHRELIFGLGLGLLVVPLLVLLDVFVLHEGWCGSLCPLGAFYALLGRYSWLRVGFDAKRCDRCGDCVRVCPESQVIHFESMNERGFIDAGDCLNCGRCLEVCPRDAYRFAPRFGRNAANELEEGDHHAMQSAA